MRSIFLLTFLTLTTLFANNFILKHDGLIDQRAQDKIKEIGAEVKTKLDANIYVYMTENIGINPNADMKTKVTQMRAFEKDISKNLNGTYALLVLAIDQHHANVIMSENLKSIVDKDTVLDEYVIPLLASKDKNTLFAKTSAAALNGYAHIADTIAASKNIELVSSIGSGGKTASTIWKVFMYSVVLIGILLYTFIILRERKIKKEMKK
jgi:hypothetical protein